MTRSARTSLAALAVGSALILTACGTSSAEEPGGGTGMVIVTTVAPITSITSNIVGDKAQVVGIVPEGTNSHTFDPPPQVAATMEKADIVFVNGLQLEEPTFELAEENAQNATIVKIADQVLPESEYIYDFSFPKEDGKPNPHLWTDPTYAIKYAGVIKDTVVAKDPANSDYYTKNYEAFVVKATALSDALKKDQATVPEGGLELLTYHDAYAYFAKTYGWKVIGAVQPSSFDEPTPAEVGALIEQIRTEGVPTIFGSEVFPSPVLEAIAAETGVRYEDSLRDDDLPGEPGSPEHSLLELLRYNYRTMITGLGGNPAALDALVFEMKVPDTAFYPQ